MLLIPLAATIGCGSSSGAGIAGCGGSSAVAAVGLAAIGPAVSGTGGISAAKASEDASAADAGTTPGATPCSCGCWPVEQAAVAVSHSASAEDGDTFITQY